MEQEVATLGRAVVTLQRKKALTSSRTPLVRKTPLVFRTPLVTRRKLLRRSPLRLVSKRRQVENRERSKLLKRMAIDGRPLCVVPGPTHYADDGHEVLFRSRGGSITDEKNIVPICRPHHARVTADKAWAESLGLAKHSWEKQQ